LIDTTKSSNSALPIGATSTPSVTRISGGHSVSAEPNLDAWFIFSSSGHVFRRESSIIREFMRGHKPSTLTPTIPPETQIVRERR
jgi:hypothetical protein